MEVAGSPGLVGELPAGCTTKIFTIYPGLSEEIFLNPLKFSFGVSLLGSGAEMGSHFVSKRQLWDGR